MPALGALPLARLPLRRRRARPVAVFMCGWLGSTRTCRTDLGLASRRTLSAWMRFCAAAPRERERRCPAAPPGRVSSRGSPRRASPSSTAPWPGTTCSACSTSGSRRVERRQVGARASRPRRASGSRPATGSRRTTSTLAHGIQTAMPSAVWPSAGCSSSSLLAERRSWPGTGSACELPAAERARALDVVLLVEVAQLALRARRARRAAAARSTRRRRAARRGTRSGRAGGPSRACVASSPTTRKPRLLGDRGQRPRARRAAPASRRRTPPRPDADQRAGRLPERAT